MQNIFGNKARAAKERIRTEQKKKKKKKSSKKLCLSSKTLKVCQRLVGSYKKKKKNSKREKHRNLHIFLSKTYYFSNFFLAPNPYP